MSIAKRIKNDIMLSNQKIYLDGNEVERNALTDTV